MIDNHNPGNYFRKNLKLPLRKAIFPLRRYLPQTPDGAMHTLVEGYFQMLIGDAWGKHVKFGLEADVV